MQTLTEDEDGKKAVNKKAWRIDRKMESKKSVTKRGGWNELEHNNTEDSKELILQQTSIEAMCRIDLQMRELK